METRTIGQIFSTLLESKGMSKLGASKQLGITDAAVHRIIKDENSPSVNRTIKVLGLFGYTLAAVKKDSELPEGSFFVERTGD